MAGYETTTLAEIYRQAAFDLDCGLYLPNAKVSSIAAGSITSTDILEDSTKGTGFYRTLGAGIYRGGSATAADNWRPAGDLTNTSGLLAQTGAVYADTTLGAENILLFYHGIRPDLDWLPLINQVLQEEYFTTTIALSHLSIADGDMSVATDTNWTDVGTPTVSAKATTAARTPYGMRSYQLTAAGVANSGTRSAAMTVGATRIVSAFTIASVAVGTASFQLYDSTNAGTTGMPAAITTTEAEPQLMVFRNQRAPSTCHAVALNMLNTSTTGDTYWNQAWLYNLENLVIKLPSYVSERFKAPRIFQMMPRYSTSPTFTWNAQGVDFVPLTEGQDYRFSIHHADANPYEVIFNNRSAFDWPLMIEASRPWYDIVASGAGFTGDADTFGGSLRTLMPKIEARLLDKIYLPRFGAKDPKWATLRQQIGQELTEANAARVTKGMAAPRPWFAGFGHA